MGNSPEPTPAPERPAQGPRRGRPTAGERERRYEHLLDVVEGVLVELGPAKLTMAEVVRRAHASKGTLYAWFTDREGMLAAVIRRNGDRSAAGITRALAAGTDPRTTLVTYSSGLLAMLTGPVSVALNRAALTHPDLAALLLAEGRHRVGPIVEAYLAEQHAAGTLRVPDPAGSFEILYGLVVRDTQIRVLLGEDPPGPDAVRARATQAVDQFLVLLDR